MSRFTQAQVDAFNARHGIPLKPILPPAAAGDGVLGEMGKECKTLIARFTVPGTPIGKPRMTRRDKWAKRPCVLRYREWADKARACAERHSTKMERARVVSWIAYFPIPKSWRDKKKRDHMGQRHLAKPDRDNCDKALLDALFSQDSGVCAGAMIKRWDDGNGPRLEVEIWA